MNSRENLNHLKREAYAGLQKRESSTGWIRKLELMARILNGIDLKRRERGTLLIAVNTGMRILDDIADGDRQPPLGVSPIEYLESKRTFIRSPEEPQDELDQLFTYCYELAAKSGFTIQSELDAFFEYFLFDAKRRGTGEIFSQAELEQAYDACDITGTIRGSLMVFGDDPEKAPLLQDLGRAVRISYSLRDYEADVAAGFINISREAIEKHRISSVDLPNRYSLSVRSWMHEEAGMGLQLLDSHREMMKENNFKRIGKVALSKGHEQPARTYLHKVMSNLDLLSRYL